MTRKILLGLSVFFLAGNLEAAEICELIVSPFRSPEPRSLGLSSYYVAYCTEELDASLYQGHSIEYDSNRRQYSASERTFLRKLILDNGYEFLTMHENLEIYKKAPLRPKVGSPGPAPR